MSCKRRSPRLSRLWGVSKMIIQDEIWRPVVGYEQYYHVSNLGRVKRIVTKGGRPIDRMLGMHLKRRYATVTLTVNSVSKTILVHRLVVLAFRGLPPTSTHEVNHINGIKHDNRLENLEWVTRSENVIHAYATGLTTPAKGERVCGAKLTWEKVREIRRLASLGAVHNDLAKQFGICNSTISKIVLMRRWKEAA